MTGLWQVSGRNDVSYATRVALDVQYAFGQSLGGDISILLRTVRRDPTRSECVVLDLNDVLRDLQRTWRDLAAEKWKLEVVVDHSGLGPGVELERHRRGAGAGGDRCRFDRRL